MENYEISPLELYNEDYLYNYVDAFVEALDQLENKNKL